MICYRWGCYACEGDGLALLGNAGDDPLEAASTFPRLLTAFIGLTLNFVLEIHVCIRNEHEQCNDGSNLLAGRA